MEDLFMALNEYDSHPSCPERSELRVRRNLVRTFQLKVSG